MGRDERELHFLLLSVLSANPLCYKNLSRHSERLKSAIIFFGNDHVIFWRTSHWLHFKKIYVLIS